MDESVFHLESQAHDPQKAGEHHKGKLSPTQAYKGYVKTLLTRKNSITGITWSEDPAIFALELANEPATTGNYEVNAGIKPGSIVNTWAQEMATHIRSLDPNHMVGARIRHA